MYKVCRLQLSVTAHIVNVQGVYEKRTRKGRASERAFWFVVAFTELGCMLRTFFLEVVTHQFYTL